MTMRQTEYGVDGTYAQRSTATSRSSPVAAQRCAEGAGLDGGDRGRSTIKGADLRAKCTSSTGATAPIGISTISRIHTSLTDVTLPGSVGTPEVIVRREALCRNADGAYISCALPRAGAVCPGIEPRAEPVAAGRADGLGSAATREWRNGNRRGLKNPRRKLLAGSSPASRRLSLRLARISHTE